MKFFAAATIRDIRDFRARNSTNATADQFHDRIRKLMRNQPRPILGSFTSISRRWRFDLPILWILEIPQSCFDGKPVTVYARIAEGDELRVHGRNRPIVGV